MCQCLIGILATDQSTVEFQTPTANKMEQKRILIWPRASRSTLSEISIMKPNAVLSPILPANQLP